MAKALLVDRLLRPIKNKILRLISRCVLQAIDHTKEIQKVKVFVFGDETLGNMDRLQDYGIETYPLADDNTEGLITFIGGNRDQGICINLTSRKYRPNDLSEGDACIYSKDSNDSNLNRVWIKPVNNTIEISNADGRKITLNNTNIDIEDGTGNKIEMKSGEINVTGTKVNLLNATEAFVNGTTFDSWITATLLTIFNAHTHSGVTAGGASTGPPSAPLTAPIGHLSTTIKGS